MIEFWHKEAGFFLCILVSAFLIGLVSDQIFPLLCVALFLYISIQLFHLYRLAHWIEKKQFSSLPETGGIWGEIYYGIHTLHELSKKHKRHMGNILNQYRKTTETLPDATMIIDENNQIIWNNKAAKKFFGLKKSDYGRRIDNILRHPELTSYLNKAMPEESLRFNYHGDRHYVFLLSLLPYQESQRLLIARDITQLAQMETSHYDLVTNTSHELKTPLTVIRGYIENLLDGESSEHKRRALQHIDQQTLRLLHTINDFLTICKLGEHNSAIKTKTVHIPNLLNQLVQQAHIMYGTLTHKLTLEIDTTKNIIGIENEIRSAFENLINNAIHYTGNNGIITIRWSEQADHALCLEVKDNGIGIPEEVINRVTERFYRANNHQNKQGSGLGLSIVQKVMDKHQGTLSIDSTIDKGSCFKCVFPEKIVCLPLENAK